MGGNLGANCKVHLPWMIKFLQIKRGRLNKSSLTDIPLG